jgi:PAS domain S-box-containing protein
MDDEPDIVKQLKEEEKLRKQQSSVQNEEFGMQGATPEETQEDVLDYIEDSEKKKPIGTDESVTEPEKISEALRESEERYKALFHSPFQLIYLHDFKGNIFDANPMTLKLLNYNKEELGTLNFSSFLDKGQLRKAIKTLKEIKKYGRQKEPTEYRLKTKNGTYIDIETTAEIVYRNGKPYAIQGIAHNITERKKAEAALKESQEKYKRLFDSSPELIIENDEEGNILAVNSAMTKSLGTPAEKLIGKNIFDILPREIAEERAKIARKAFEEMKNQAFEDERAGRYFQNIYVPIINPDGKRTIQLIARDVTSQKKADATLKESEEKFKKLFDDAPAGIALVDKNRIIKEANNSLLQLLPIQKEEFIGKNFVELVSAFGLDVKENITDFSNRLTEKSPKREITFLNRNNSKTTINVQSLVIKSSDEIIGVLYYIEDITERKQAEEVLKESEERHRVLFESSRDAIMTLESPSWKFTIGNPATIAMFKAKNVEEFISYGPGTLSPERQPDGRVSTEKTKEMIETAMREGSNFFEWTHKRLDGTEFPATVLLTRMEIKGRQVLQATVRDISEQKQFETEREKILLWKQSINTLQQSLLAPASLEDKLQMITDSVVRLFDADFCRIWLNQPGDLCEQGCIHAQAREGPHVCRNRDQCLHLLASSGRYTHTDGKIHRRVPFGCYKIGRIASEEDHKFLTNDVQNDPPVHNNDWARELGLVSFAGYQLRVPRGKIIGVLALFAKHPILPAEDAMLDGLSNTVTRVVTQAVADETLRESTRKIEAQNVQLQKLNKIKTDFLNITSHELRTPMSAIKGYIQMILKQNLGTITNEQKKALEVILRNTNRLDRLIQDILDISRLESGTMKFVTGKTAVKQMIKEIVDTMQVSASLKGIGINTEVGESIPELKIDKDRITQVVVNILNNAIKFSPESSIINVQVKKQDDNVLFEVQDYGRGIPKEYHQKIFQTFYQVDSNTDTKFGGAGLGLAICYGIIIAHGGRIWVESTGKPGEGSTFKFVLPIESVSDIEKRFKEVDIFGLETQINEDEDPPVTRVLGETDQLKPAITIRDLGEKTDLNGEIRHTFGDEPQKRHGEYSQFLSQTAIEFAQFPADDDIFKYICEKIQQITNGANVTLTYHDEKTDRFCIYENIGYEKNLTKIFQNNGKNPRDLEFNLGEDDIRQKLLQGKLVHLSIDDFNRLVMPQLPKAVSPSVDQLINMNEVYTIGLVNEKKLLGNVFFIAPKGGRPENPNVIETFINQAAVTLQRNNAIKELNNVKKDREVQNIKLQKLNEIKTTFLKTTSHELRTPITSIKGYIQMLMKKNLGEINEEQKKSLEVMLRNTNRLDQVIQNILDTTNLQSGIMKLIPNKVNPSTLIKETTQTIQSFAYEKHITINSTVEKHLPDLIVDIERIKQVLINIISNAIKFSTDSSIININVKKEREDVLFEVQDFGIGIPKDKQEMIFDTFYQVDSSDVRQYSGTGLSLALSKGIVMLHGGKMWLESTMGKGSTFRFTLPIKSIYGNEWDENITMKKQIIMT